jgi:hypothetical protein
MNNGFPYTAADLVKKLDDSQQFMDRVTSGFAERNERVFYRKPPVNTNGQMEYAELVDNTLASYLEKMPKNVIQKLPTFMIDAHTRMKAEDLVYEFIAVKILLRSGSSKGYGLLQKQWIELRNAASFGACAVYLPFENDNGEFTVGEVPIYWGDLYPEAWSMNLNATNFTQFRNLKTEDDIKSLINGRDDEVGGTWDKKGLQDVLDFGAGQSTGKARSVNTKAAMNGLPEHMYELFKYVDENWVVDWHYASSTILRVVPNTSRRRRVIGLYSDYDGSSIMGRSLIDMAYGAQQTLTSLLRNFVYTSDYNTDPAKTVKGISLNEDTFNLTKGNTMFLNDEEGKVDLHPIDTTTIQNFPNLYNLLKTVLLTSLPSSSDSSISSGSGDPTFSKTQAGVNDQAQKADIENNYYRKNYETYFEMALENKLNIYLAEIKAIADKNNAVPEIELDEEYANLVREALPEGKENFISADNKVRLNLSNMRGVNVSVNFESTRDMAKEEDLKRLNSFMTGFFEVAKSNPSMEKVMRSVIPLLMEEMAKSSNLENSSKMVAEMKKALLQVAKEEEDAKAQAAEDAKRKNQPMDEVKAPTVSISFKDLPPAGKIQAAAEYGIQLTAQDVMGADGDGADAENASETKAESAGGMQ